jgi:Zn-dependent metalloprotease
VLASDTSVGWKVVVDRRSNEVRFLAPNSATAIAAAGTAPEGMARAFFQKYATALGATDQERLVLTDQTTDSFGHTSVRFDHLLEGTDIPIFDTSSLAAFTADGRLVHAQTGFTRDLSNVARTASVAAQAAEATAVERVRIECALPSADAIARRATTLGVSAEPGAAPVLVWAIDLRTHFGTCVAPRVLVDAATGAVLSLRETAAFLKDRAGGVRFFALKEGKDTKEIDVTETSSFVDTRRWVMKSTGAGPKVTTSAYGRFTNTTIETDTLGKWDASSPFQGAAVDAHYYAGKALEYFKEVHGRSGLDGKGADLPVIVHDPEAASQGQNAHYEPALFLDDELHVGDGGGNLLPLSAGFDVMAHELAHGVTAHTSKLPYRGESGAMNETFSDVMGASAENWLPETRSVTDNVLIGERATLNGHGIRNMDDPAADLGNGNGGNVDHYRDVAPCVVPSAANDRCGVHNNSGIGNRAFTLMTLGGLHRLSRVAVAKGIGWETSRQLWYNSFTRLTPLSNYVIAAYAQLAVALTQGVDVAAAVGCAWFAVGVLDPIDLRARNILCVGSNPPQPPAPSPSAITSSGGCNGRTTGYVCSEGTPGFALACQLGAPPVYCADTQQVCKMASPSDPTAAVSADGVVVCE